MYRQSVKKIRAIRDMVARSNRLGDESIFRRRDMITFEEAGVRRRRNILGIFGEAFQEVYRNCNRYDRTRCEIVHECHW
jgi:hypothetical protein